MTSDRTNNRRLPGHWTSVHKHYPDTEYIDTGTDTDIHLSPLSSLLSISSPSRLLFLSRIVPSHYIHLAFIYVIQYPVTLTMLTRSLRTLARAPGASPSLRRGLMAPGYDRYVK
jgi:hypothetical protein